MRSRRFPAFVALAALTAAIPLYGVACREIGDYTAPPDEVATAIDSGTTLELSASSEVAVEHEVLVLTARVHPISGSAGMPKRGLVMFTAGSKVLGSAPLDASGVAKATTSSLLAGEYRIVATYTGSRRFTGSDASMSLRVIPPGG